MAPFLSWERMPNRDRDHYYRDFNKAFKITFLEKDEEIEAILENSNALKYVFEEAYVNWDDLTSTHQVYLKLTRPKEYQQLKVVSDTMKFALLNIGLCFTDETISIIHEMLYKF